MEGQGRQRGNSGRPVRRRRYTSEILTQPLTDIRAHPFLYSLTCIFTESLNRRDPLCVNAAQTGVVVRYCTYVAVHTVRMSCSIYVIVSC